MRLYKGWAVVAVAALAMVGTLPARTQGLGLITEPLLSDFHKLGLDRIGYANINFWATMAGALGALGIGRLLDRLGARVALTFVVIALAMTVAATSRATSIIGLAIALAATRVVGQGALSVVSIAMVGHWFKRRINSAMAVYSIALSVGFMIAFPVVGSFVESRGWRLTWLAIAIALAFVLAPVGWLVVRRTPESVALRMDGDAPNSAAAAQADDASALSGYTWPQALRTGAFWVFAIGSSLYGLIASGVGLFNESILAERGFSHDVYFQTLAVTAITALAGNFLGGWLADRWRPTLLMSAAMFILTAGVAVLPHLASIGGVMAWAVAMGIGGGVVMVLFFSVWPKVFGRKHLGRIQGAAQALTVIASALGPVLLAWCVDATGSYAMMFNILSVVTAVVALACLAVVIPPQIES